MNRAERRRRKDEELPDPRLWDHEPLFAQRWLQTQFILVPVEDWTSEQNRDAHWGASNGWSFTYFPDGSKEAETASGAKVRFPSTESRTYRTVAA